MGIPEQLHSDEEGGMRSRKSVRFVNKSQISRPWSVGTTTTTIIIMIIIAIIIMIIVMVMVMIMIIRLGQALVSWYKGGFPSGGPCYCTVLLLHPKISTTIIVWAISYYDIFVM